MIRLKPQDDIDKLAEGGAILAGILDRLEGEVKVGIEAVALDRTARQLIAEAGCRPSFLDYAPAGHRPYPAALCISVNDAVVHGLPDKRKFTEGDVIGIDLGLIYEDKYYVDAARTVGVGRVPKEAKHLIAVTKGALKRGIEASMPGNSVGHIGEAIQRYVEGEGLQVVRQLVGHGVGYEVHEPPQVPNFGRAGAGDRLEPGLVIAIEPMVTIGDSIVETGNDGWSVRVKTGNLTAHQENTVAVTAGGPRVLTKV